MQLQTILTSIIVGIWYFGAALVIFDFLYGIPSLMQEVAMQQRTQQTLVVQPQPLSTTKTVRKVSELANISESNFEEATLQYLEMVGGNIEDFESIAQARAFLDEHAPWTIEVAPKQLKQQASNTEPIPEQQERLTYVQVKAEFAKLGWKFEKYRTGHNRYRVNVNGLFHRFKTLSDALDWLNVSKRLLQVAPQP
jgi:ribonuclease BN (tRNA processing enzyme)